MKKSLILAVAAASLVACSDNFELSSELTAPQGIQFSVYTNLAKTRGIVTTTDNIDSIRVTAIAVKGKVGSQAEEENFFTNILVTKENSKWGYKGTQYFWPAYPLNFYAHNFPKEDKAQGEGVLKFNDTDNKIQKDKHCITFTTGTNIDSLKDIVVARVATVSDDTVSNHTVNLKFTHALSKVRVEAKNLKDSLYKIEVKGIKFANVVKKGTYNFGDFKAAEDSIYVGAWTMADTTATSGDPKLVIDYRSLGSATAKDCDSIVVLKKDTYKDIDFSNNDSSWMFIPQILPNWVSYDTVHKDKENKEIDSTNVASKAYIGLLVRITTIDGGAKIYPATCSETKDAYTNDGFAWIAIPFGKNFELKQAKSYTIKLNFFSEGGGVGLVDPEEPGDLDGDKDPNNDPGKAVIPGTNPDDVNNEDKAQEILFSVSVENWSGAESEDYNGFDNKDL